MRRSSSVDVSAAAALPSNPAYSAFFPKFTGFKKAEVEERIAQLPGYVRTQKDPVDRTTVYQFDSLKSLAFAVSTFRNERLQVSQQCRSFIDENVFAKELKNASFQIYGNEDEEEEGEEGEGEGNEEGGEGKKSEERAASKSFASGKNAGKAVAAEPEDAKESRTTVEHRSVSRKSVDGSDGQLATRNADEKPLKATGMRKPKELSEGSSSKEKSEGKSSNAVSASKSGTEAAKSAASQLAKRKRVLLDEDDDEADVLSTAPVPSPAKKQSSQPLKTESFGKTRYIEIEIEKEKEKEKEKELRKSNVSALFEDQPVPEVPKPCVEQRTVEQPPPPKQFVPEFMPDISSAPMFDHVLDPEVCSFRKQESFDLVSFMHVMPGFKSVKSTSYFVFDSVVHAFLALMNCPVKVEFSPHTIPKIGVEGLQKLTDWLDAACGFREPVNRFRIAIRAKSARFEDAYRAARAAPGFIGKFDVPGFEENLRVSAFEFDSLKSACSAIASNILVEFCWATETERAFSPAEKEQVRLFLENPLPRTGGPVRPPTKTSEPIAQVASVPELAPRAAPTSVPVPVPLLVPVPVPVPASASGLRKRTASHSSMEFEESERSAKRAFAGPVAAASANSSSSVWPTLEQWRRKNLWQVSFRGCSVAEAERMLNNFPGFAFARPPFLSFRSVQAAYNATMLFPKLHLEFVSSSDQRLSSEQLELLSRYYTENNQCFIRSFADACPVHTVNNAISFSVIEDCCSMVPGYLGGSRSQFYFGTYRSASEAKLRFPELDFEPTTEAIRHEEADWPFCEVAPPSEAFFLRNIHEKQQGWTIAFVDSAKSLLSLRCRQTLHQAKPGVATSATRTLRVRNVPLDATCRDFRFLFSGAAGFETVVQQSASPPTFLVRFSTPETAYLSYVLRASTAFDPAWSSTPIVLDFVSDSTILQNCIAR
eukprot:ANDGO_07858.mRNA.1 hypothetical protein